MDSADSLESDIVQTLFGKFIAEFEEHKTIKYLSAATTLQYSEQNALIINYDDVYNYNQNLAIKITEDFHNVYPFLKKAILEQIFKYAGYDARNRVQNKTFCISFINAPNSYMLNQLTKGHIGSLITILGQVIAEPYNICYLLKKDFVCGDCNTLNKDMDLSFMFDPPKVCINVECGNQSNFVENSYEVLQGPFTLLQIIEDLSSDNEYKVLEVLVRDDMLNTVQNGGYFDFTGVLITIMQANSPEEIVEAERIGNFENSQIVLLATGVCSRSCEEECRSNLSESDEVRMQDSTASTSQAGSSDCSLRCTEELNQ